MDITHVLEYGWPGAQWSLHGETYEGLIWHDTQAPKPTLEEIQNMFISYQQSEIYNTRQLQKNHSDLLRQLEEIDRKSIRALRENNVQRLTQLENEAIAIRAQFNK